jgi:hypothetical protein
MEAVTHARTGITYLGAVKDISGAAHLLRNGSGYQICRAIRQGHKKDGEYEQLPLHGFAPPCGVYTPGRGSQALPVRQARIVTFYLSSQPR